MQNLSPSFPGHPLPLSYTQHALWASNNMLELTTIGAVTIHNMKHCLKNFSHSFIPGSI